MTTRKKVLIGVGVLVLAGAVIGANLYFRRDTGTTVNVEAIRTRDLNALVSASGRIQPKRQVNISANQMGRVTRLAVEEGQRVKQGQFLLEIDPRQLEGRLQRGEAGVAAAQSGLQQARLGIEQAQTNLAAAETRLQLATANLKRQQELWNAQLTSRETLERAQNEATLAAAEVKSRQQDVQARRQDVQTREQQIKQEEAGLAETRYNLTQIVIESPMDGLVVRRNIEEGETAVVGTMNNAGSNLLTIADMSVLEAEVEVDETDIPFVQIGQAAEVSIDAVPDRTFKGRVTEIGNSPIQAANAAAGGQRQATTFRVVVTIDEEVPDVRPGFTCTAEITTATRKGATAVPIQSLTVRELQYDAQGKIVPKEPTTDRRRRRNNRETTTVSADDLPPGHELKETEGVFVVRDGRAVFTPVKIGIAGEQYFEVLEGLKPGDQVITGPFASVRELDDGQDVRVEEDSNVSRSTANANANSTE